ncbi:MAG: tetratricopeptide repeat protein [Leptolyngbyaceae cyanobacterium CSU_1_4]|nr:tetratricopeptide repeat protein [Leptolyngbyaceae cyanobacterium CSU_1_4]
MLSNNPSKPSKPSNISLGNLFLSKEAEAQQFLALNSSSLAELLTFIDFAENLAIAFVEVNFPPDANALIEALQHHPQCQDIQFVVFDFSQQPELRFLRDELVQRLATMPRDENKKLMLVVRGLERAIGISGNDPPVLQDLNFIRDAYKTSVPHPMLFILPDYAVTRLAKFAPDFWAWRSGVFQFQTTPKTRDDALKFLEPKMVDRRYDKPVSPERIETLERLLMEYQPSGQAIASDDLGTCGDILHQLGVAYLSRNNPRKAGEYLFEALKLAEQQEDLLLQARVKSDLGEAYLRQKEYERAIAYVQQALKIQEQLSDPHGKAESLKIQGEAYGFLERYEEALVSYDQSIHLNPDNHDAWYFRGIMLCNLGHYEEAIASLDQSIHRNRYDPYAWHYRGIALYDLGRYEEAIASYEQSIHRNPGSYYTWIFRGDALCDLGRYEEAITSYDQSIHLNPDDRYTWSKRGNALLYLERYEEAIVSYQKSLEITRQIGDCRAEAVLLFILGVTSLVVDRKQEAIQLFQNARQLFQELGSEKDVKNCENAIASLEPSN